MSFAYVIRVRLEILEIWMLLQQEIFAYVIHVRLEILKIWKLLQQELFVMHFYIFSKFP